MKSFASLLILSTLVLLGHSQDIKSCANKIEQFESKAINLQNELGKQIEQQRQYLKKIYRNDLARNHDMVYMEVSPDGYILFVCDHVPSQLGFFKSDMYGHKVVDFVHPDDKICTEIVLLDMSETRCNSRRIDTFFYNRFRTAWGEYKYFLWKVRWREDNGTLYCIAEVFTELRWNEEFGTVLN